MRGSNSIRFGLVDLESGQRTPLVAHGNGENDYDSRVKANLRLFHRWVGGNQCFFFGTTPRFQFALPLQGSAQRVAWFDVYERNRTSPASIFRAPSGVVHPDSRVRVARESRVQSTVGAAKDVHGVHASIVMMCEKWCPSTRAGYCGARSEAAGVENQIAAFGNSLVTHDF